MKKSVIGWLIIGFGLAFLVPGVLAEEIKSGFAGYGFTVGMNMAQIAGGSYGSQLKAGMMFGGFVNYKISDLFSLQGELLFTQKGESTTDTLETGTLKTWLTVNYLEMPILAKFSFGAARLSYYALAGPYFAFKVGGKFSSEFEGQNYESGLDSHYKSFDMGLKVGGGIGIPLSPSQLQIALIAGVGLLPILPKSSYSLRNFYVALTIALFVALHQ